MITFDNVSKVYPDGTVAVDDLTLAAPNGKITTLVGPSGCGKTTSMRMINRLIEPSSGTIELDGVDTQTLDRVALRRTDRLRHPERRPVSRTAPSSTTSPPCRDCSAAARRKPARRQWNCWSASGSTRSSPSRYPWQLSGGQQQRVGVARALATDPPFLLMDEPFSAVDPIVRSQLQDEFLRLQADISKTIVMVTHDIDEALKLGDQVVVLREGGTLAQAATPAELLAAPNDAFVADFVGSARGYRALGFHTSDDLLDARPTSRPSLWDKPSRRSRRRTDGGSWWSTRPTRRSAGSTPRTCAATRVQDGDVNLSATSARRGDPLRDLLNSALSSPSGRCVVTDESGTLLGTATDHDVIDAIRRAKDARSVGVGMNWISSNLDRIVDLTISHVWLTLVPTVLGLLVALPLGWWAHRSGRGYAAIVGTAGLLYTIPSLALFIILPIDPRHEDPRPDQHRRRADALHRWHCWCASSPTGWLRCRTTPWPPPRPWATAAGSDCCWSNCPSPCP